MVVSSRLEDNLLPVRLHNVDEISIERILLPIVIPALKIPPLAEARRLVDMLKYYESLVIACFGKLVPQPGELFSTHSAWFAS